MLNYELEPEQYMAVDLSTLSQEEIDELAYFLWGMFHDHDELMAWRQTVLLPLVTTHLSVAEVEDEEEND